MSHRTAWFLAALSVACSHPKNSNVCVDKTGQAHGALLASALPYRGVALSSAEFCSEPFKYRSPCAHGTGYVWPDPAYAEGYASADYYLGKGMTTFRLPFSWENLQPTLSAAFDTTELARLQTTVSDLRGKGAVVLLDPHNYARWKGDLIGSASVPNGAFADLWSRLAALYKDDAGVLFGLMNEPHDMSTDDWAAAANAAIVAIRATGATNLILVPGNDYTGAADWSNDFYGTANSVAMLTVTDSGDNFAFEVHAYLDSNASGTSETCTSTTIGAERMQPFTDWLHANHRRGFLGEFSGGPNTTCLTAIDGQLAHLEANRDVYLGWSYWAGGPWYGPDPSLEPNTDSSDKAQMTTLLSHITYAPPDAGASAGSSSGASAGSGSSAGSASGGGASAGSTSGHTGGAAAGGASGSSAGNSTSGSAPTTACKP